MIDWLPVFAAFAVVAATYLAALTQALINASRSQLQDALEARGRSVESVNWLFNRLDPTVLAIALLRTTARVAVTVFVIAQVVRLDTQAYITWSSLLVAAVIASALLWLFTSVLAGALARHAAVGLISTALPAMKVVHFLLSPLTRAVWFVDEGVRRLTGTTASRADAAEEELLRSIEDTQQEGALDPQAAQMLENVVEFRTTEVVQIMTPRTDIEGLEFTDDLSAIRAMMMNARHSRVPVYVENLDHIVGILYVKDLTPYIGLCPGEFRLKPLLRKPIVVPESKPVRALLNEFRQGEMHMAIVIDEYGGTAGILTIEDVLEEIVGDIRDEHEHADEPDPTLTIIDDMHSEVDGRYYISELNSRLGLSLPENGDYDTIAGFVMSKLGRVPSVGESLVSHNASFKVTGATPMTISRLAIEKLEPAPDEGETEDPTRQTQHAK